MENQWSLYELALWMMKLSKMRFWMTMKGELSRISWWRITSFVYYSFVSEPRINRPSSVRLQYHGNETDKVSATHLVAGMGDVIAILRVITIPGTREEVIIERAHVQTRICDRPRWYLRGQFGILSLLNQKVRNSVGNQRDCVGSSACPYVVVS